MELTSFASHLEEHYGPPGTPRREAFERRARAFIIGEMLKDARRTARMSQEELARRAETKKSYISRLENGKIDVQISTFFRIIEKGLGRTVNLTIR